MPLSASGQWTVDAAMRLMDISDRKVWASWADTQGWRPSDRKPKRLPRPIASLAITALEKFISELTRQIDHGVLSESEELDAMNDLDSAKAALSGLQADLQPA